MHRGGAEGSTSRGLGVGMMIVVRVSPEVLPVRRKKIKGYMPVISKQRSVNKTPVCVAHPSSTCAKHARSALYFYIISVQLLFLFTFIPLYLYSILFVFHVVFISYILMLI